METSFWLMAFSSQSPTFFPLLGEKLNFPKHLFKNNNNNINNNNNNNNNNNDLLE